MDEMPAGLEMEDSEEDSELDEPAPNLVSAKSPKVRVRLTVAAPRMALHRRSR